LEQLTASVAMIGSVRRFGQHPLPAASAAAIWPVKMAAGSSGADADEDAAAVQAELVVSPTGPQGLGAENCRSGKWA